MKSGDVTWVDALTIMVAGLFHYVGIDTDWSACSYCKALLQNV